MNSTVLKCSILCTIWLTGLTLKAQYYEADTTSIALKNSFGLYLNAPVAIAIRAGTNHLRNGMQYKRLLQDYKKFRLSFFHQFNEEYNSNILNYYSYDTLLIESTSFSKYDYAEFRMGLEWSDYTEQFDTFYAIDIVTGFDKSINSVWETSHEIENNGFRQATKLIKDDTEKSLMVGLAALIGYRVDIQKHWDITGNFSPEFIYKLPISSHSSLPQPGAINRCSLHFNLRILDLVLAYRF